GPSRVVFYLTVRFVRPGDRQRLWASSQAVYSAFTSRNRLRAAFASGAPTIVGVQPGRVFGVHYPQPFAGRFRLRCVLAQRGLLDLDPAPPGPDATLIGALTLTLRIVVGVRRQRRLQLREVGQVDRQAVRAVR